jgi:hypothetical protein
VALRILCLTGRSDERPGGARATKGGLDQSARAGGWLESLAGGRSAGRIETARLIASAARFQVIPVLKNDADRALALIKSAEGREASRAAIKSWTWMTRHAHPYNPQADALAQP